VRLLVQQNYKGLAIGRTYSDELKELQKEYSEDLYYEKFDLYNTSEIHNLCKHITKKYGRVYGLINNAALGNDGVLATMHETEISQSLKVNVEAPILLTKYLLRGMLIGQVGRIINISSIIASTGFNGLAVYGATKAALAGFTKSLCREVGKANITVNNIAPGYMATEMTTGLEGDKLKSIKRRSPLGKLAEVDEVANGILFLLDEKSSSITGTTLTIDAGSTA
jgi:3-oxoacyl-[acyl-carrier protein] reductase